MRQKHPKSRQWAFELSDFDKKLLKFSSLFRSRFMDIHVSMPLSEALDLCWETLAECFEPHELLMKQALTTSTSQGRINAMVKTLGKNDLQKETQKLTLYQKLLPSIDLKRNQLMANNARAKSQMIDLKKQTEQVICRHSQHLADARQPGSQSYPG
jgi:hypothetical protein